MANSETGVIEELRQELAKARSLLTSNDWLVWVRFLRNERRPALQLKVNGAVEKGNIEDARVFLALMKDCEYQISLFSEHLKSIESQINQGGKDEY